MEIFATTRLNKKQNGATIIEFAIVVLFVFFPLLLAIMEFGRVFYVWNTVQEVTRRAAREAVVRDFSLTEVGKIQRLAVFRPEDSTGTVGLPGAGDVLNNLYVKIIYLQSDGTNEVAPYPDDPADNISACSDVTRQNSCIRYVKAQVCSGTPCTAINYIPMLGLFGMLNINIPTSAIIMPAESLGFTISS